MALSDKGAAPYAPVSALTKVIEHHRDRGMPTPIAPAGIQRLGVEISLARRTLSAMKILGLVDDEGMPTAQFEELRVAPTDQFQSTLSDWLRSEYKSIFDYVQPSDDVQRVVDQFRHYDPPGMRNRMVTLFLGLCRYAGLIEAVPSLPRSTPAAKSNSGEKPKPPSKVSATRAKVERKQSYGPPEPEPKSSPDAMQAARQRYVNLLLSKADEQQELNADLLDRIERALGFAESVGGDN